MDVSGPPDLALGVADAVPFHILHALKSLSRKADTNNLIRSSHRCQAARQIRRLIPDWD